MWLANDLHEKDRYSITYKYESAMCYNTICYKGVFFNDKAIL